MLSFCLRLFCVLALACSAFCTQCQVTGSADNTNITCANVGQVPSLEERLRQQQVASAAAGAKALDISGTGFAVSENALTPFVNLERLVVFGGPQEATIHPQALRQLAKLRHLSIGFAQLQKDKVDELFAPLANSLEKLSLFVVKNVERINTLRDFTKLQEVSFEQVDLKEIPRLQNSAATLRKLHIGRAHLGTISADTFRGLSNLERLDIGESSVSTIEQGAFNDLSNLKELILTCNYGLSGITPDMFRNTPQLRKIHLLGTRANITQEQLNFLGSDLELQTGMAIC